MADEKPLDQLDSGELFRSAQAPEPVTAEELAKPEPAPVTHPEVPKEPVGTTIPQSEAAVPSWRLREEAEARRTAEDRARALETRLAEIATHMQQNAKQPDFFENPDQATQALILRTLQPFAAEIQRANEDIRRVQMYNSKVIAAVRHGEDKVDEAEQAFLKARDDQALDPADYERVVQAPNRYDAVVQWHKRQSVLSSVGDDPAAWFEKQLEAKMADPKFQATLLERVRGGAASRPSMTKLPPSLSRSTAAAGNSDAAGDMSDQSLFAFATKRLT